MDNIVGVVKFISRFTDKWLFWELLFVFVVGFLIKNANGNVKNSKMNYVLLAVVFFLLFNVYVVYDCISYDVARRLPS